MSQSFVCLHYHIIFSTKHRASFISPDLEPRLYEYIGGIIRQMDGHLLSAGGMPDHLHLLCALGKQWSIADALRTIKANSSRWVHQTFLDRKEFAWQRGYAAFATSCSDLDRVKQYIQHQPEHHRKMTFKEELIALLERHRIEYDERYLWE